ncbi:MAG: hypothetical protein EON61_03570 [Alphaproteobacteria bacterium]|nr:MAG: hypothetical protein EON61_03570 [Alphaproteobacteria bacterium]
MAALVREDERLKRDFPLISLPVLIPHGAADKVAKPGGSQVFYDQAGSADKHSGSSMIATMTCSVILAGMRSVLRSKLGANAWLMLEKRGGASGLISRSAAAGASTQWCANHAALSSRWFAYCVSIARTMVAGTSLGRPRCQPHSKLSPASGLHLSAQRYVRQ